MNRSANTGKTKILFCTVLLFAAALFFFKLGDRSFRNPDEGRYAEIAREMTVTGNWMEPKIYGVDYLKKPPLFYWLIALSLKILGPNEWAARLVPALFGVFGVLMTFWFVRKTFNEETAFFSCLVLASNFWYLQVGRYLVIDAVFSFFVVSGLYFFYLMVHSKENKFFNTFLFYLCVSFSFLAKGVLGVILPGISIVLYALLTKKIGVVLKEINLALGFVVFSLIALPWFVLIASKNPGFLKLFFWHENFSRFASENFEHQEAWYFYLALLPVILIPWSLFLKPLKAVIHFSSAKDNGKDEKIFLLATSLGMLSFFSLSRSKLLTYLLPCVPFISILIGKAWSDWQKNTSKPYWTERMPVFALIFLGLTTIITAPKLIAHFGPEMPKSFEHYIQWMGSAVLAGGIAALRALKRQNGRHLFYSLILMTAVLSILFSFVIESANADYTNKQFALGLKPKLHPQDKVFIYDHPGALYDFGFYLEHPVTLVGLEGELEFSRNDPKNEKASVTHEQFRKMLENGEKLVCLARKSDFLDINIELRKKLVVLQEDRRKVLFST